METDGEMAMALAAHKNEGRQMNEIVEKMKLLAPNAEYRRALGKVVTKDGIAYVTDGRVGFLYKDDAGELAASPEEHLEEYPVVSLARIVDKSVGDGEAFGWRVLCHGEEGKTIADLEKKFAEAYQNAKVDARRSFRSRYTEVSCPCCGATLYWDSDDDRLVSEEWLDEDKPEDVTFRDVSIPVWVEFGGERVLVNYAYLHVIGQVFGDLLMSHDGDGKIVFRSRDGRVKGTVMPLRCSGEPEVVATLETAKTEQPEKLDWMAAPEERKEPEEAEEAKGAE